MNKYRSGGSSGSSGAPASLASGALGWSGSPLAGLAGAPLPPLLPLLWHSNHCCSLPYVIYYLIFDSICNFFNYSTFISYLSLDVGGGRWW